MSGQSRAVLKAKKISDPQADLSALHKAYPSLQPATSTTSTTYAKTRDEIKTWTSLIYSYHASLNVYLDHWADTIQKRWQNKSVVQRVKVLDEAWKDASGPMAQIYSPNLEACLRFGVAVIPQTTRMHFQMPEINHEELSKARPLMLMMESRARNNPEAFAAFDRASMRLGFQTKILNAPVLTGWAMHLSGRKSEKSYGQLEKCATFNDAEESLDEGITIEPAQGIAVLEKQAILLALLVNCAKLILPEITEERIDAIHQQKISLPTCSSTLHQGSNNGPLDALIEAPYQLPVSIKTIDFKRLGALVYAKHAEAADHLWNLRQDPGYYLDTLLEIGEHYIENLPDTQGNKHPNLHTRAFWQRVATAVAKEAYSAPLQWRLAEKHLMAVEASYLSLHDQLSPGKRLPRNLEKLISKLFDQTQTLLLVFTELFKHFLEPSPPLRKYYTRKAQDSIYSPNLVIFRRSKKQFTLLWLLEQLQSVKAVRFYGLHNLLPYIHRIMLAEPSGRKPVSGYLAKVLSHMAVVDEIERNISLMRIKKRSTSDIERTDLNKEFVEESNHAAKLVPKSQPQPQWSGAEGPAEALEYPADKERTQQTTHRMRLSEYNLDALWKPVLKGKTDEEWFKAIAPILNERKMKRTPEWGITDGNADWKEFTFRSPSLPAALENLDASLAEFNAVIDDICSHGEPKEAEKVLKFLQTAKSLEGKRLEASKGPHHPRCSQASEDWQAKQDVQAPVPSCSAQGSKKVEVILPESDPEPIPLPETSQSSSAMQASIRPDPLPEAIPKAIPNTLSNTVPTKPTVSPPIPLGKKAYKVFMTLFPANSQGGDMVAQSATAATVQWSDFVNAMVRISFTAEKLVGSAWLFTLKDDEGKSVMGIIFHEPHPGLVISARMAKYMGERLNWEFELKRESFTRATGGDE
ncbi:MAG: hypothetical protein Q9174_002800 [Haloplaca sp. 1 TL-2023]